MQFKSVDMKKTCLLTLGFVLLFTSCAQEFNRVYKSSDYRYKYEYAKECFAEGKYTRATTLLQDLIVPEKGSRDAQECLYMLGMAEYCSRDYVTASETFSKYTKSYPRGYFAEMAYYYVGQSLYMSTPEPRPSWWRKSSIRPGSITTSEPISATAPTAATTMRLASSRQRMP